MRFKTTVAMGLGLVAWLIAPVSATAECVKRPARAMAKLVMENEGIELAFSGTVVGSTRTTDVGYRITFEVERVWKGTVPKQFDLYVWALRAENPRFYLGRHYVALATKLTNHRAREGVGISSSDTVAFEPVQCSDSSLLDPSLARFLGPGLPPKT